MLPTRRRAAFANQRIPPLRQAGADAIRVPAQFADDARRRIRRVANRTSCHLSSPVVWLARSFTAAMLVDCDLQMKSAAMFSSTMLTGNSGFVNMVGNYAFTATPVTGAVTRSCAGNANITCERAVGRPSTFQMIANATAVLGLFGALQARGCLILRRRRHKAHLRGRLLDDLIAAMV